MRISARAVACGQAESGNNSNDSSSDGTRLIGSPVECPELDSADRETVGSSPPGPCTSPPVPLSLSGEGERSSVTPPLPLGRGGRGERDGGPNIFDARILSCRTPPRRPAY